MLAPLGAPERLVGLEPLETTGDEVRARMRTAPWMRTEQGRPASGLLAIPIDVVVGHAALFARPEGHWAVTTALSMEVARPVPCDGSTISITGRLVSAEAGSALAAGKIVDADGLVLAVGTVWTRFTPGLPDFGAVRADAGDARAARATGVLDAVHAVLGSRADGRPGLTLAADAITLNAAGVVHGGVVAAAGDVLAAAATEDADRPLVTGGLRMSYLRPVPAEPVDVAATVEHRGRTTALTTVEALDRQGRRCVVGTVTARAA